MNEQTLIVDGEPFELLGMQRGGAAVYRGRGKYLRIGPKTSIERDLKLHRDMESAHFPVARIVSSGQYKDSEYFVETAFDGKSFRNIFADEHAATGVIADDSLALLGDVVERLFDAQHDAMADAWQEETVAEAVHLEDLCREMPQRADAIRSRFATAIRRLRDFPAVITHGDCNPSNIYAEGIIDLEDSFIGPLGFDMASVISTQEWFPPPGDYEFPGKYEFSDAQKQRFVKRFDARFVATGLPSFAVAFEEFAFCRAVWLCANMGKWPKTQKWRFEKLEQDHLRG